MYTPTENGWCSIAENTSTMMLENVLANRRLQIMRHDDRVQNSHFPRFHPTGQARRNLADATRGFKPMFPCR
jgi:hypothetical protein